MTADSGRLCAIAIALVAAAGCRLTDNEKAAVRACVSGGNGSEECRIANAGLASGNENIGATVRQAVESAEASKRFVEEAEQRGKAAVAEGQDPCAALLARIRAEFPPPCKGAEGAVEFAEQGDGCAAALGDWEATRETVPDFLESCP